jgi:signal transduction histidine kinase
VCGDLHLPNISIQIFGGTMKKAAFLTIFAVLFSVSYVQADEGKATTEDVYNLVLKAYEVVSALGEESFAAFNDPKGEFVYKDTYAYIERCPGAMVAHPFALEKLKGVDLNKAFEFNARLCSASEQPGGGWGEYSWPKPGETDPARKVAYGIKVEGTPYSIFAGIYSDTAKIEDLNKTLR